MFATIHAHTWSSQGTASAQYFYRPSCRPCPKVGPESFCQLTRSSCLFVAAAPQHRECPRNRRRGRRAMRSSSTPASGQGDAPDAPYCLATRGEAGSAGIRLGPQSPLLIQPGRRRRTRAVIQRQDVGFHRRAFTRRCRPTCNDGLVRFLLGQHLADVPTRE